MKGLSGCCKFWIQFEGKNKIYIISVDIYVSFISVVLVFVMQRNKVVSSNFPMNFSEKDA